MLRLSKKLLYGKKHNSSKINYDDFWQNIKTLYQYYPSFRHRTRIILSILKKQNINDQTFIFDYGCGIGLTLASIKKLFKLNDTQLGGLDISKEAIDMTKELVNSPYLYIEAFPDLEKKCDVIICSEVVEHTKNYPDILIWIKNNLSDNGIAIITTQAGKIHQSDKCFGHLHHFEISELETAVCASGLNVKYSFAWGFPLYTLQKYLTNINFSEIEKNYLKGNFSFCKLLILKIAYLTYFINDILKIGPQIYTVASKK